MAVRKPPWKLVRWVPSDDEEAYRLDLDPREQHRRPRAGAEAAARRFSTRSSPACAATSSCRSRRRPRSPGGWRTSATCEVRRGRPARSGRVPGAPRRSGVVRSRRRRRRPRSATLAATWNVTAREDDGGLVGMGRVQDDGLYASIWDMIVLPEHRGRGIGGAIFERMLAHCRGRSLVALVATPLGAPMYRAAGFSEESRGSIALFLRDVARSDAQHWGLTPFLHSTRGSERRRGRRARARPRRAGAPRARSRGPGRGGRATVTTRCHGRPSLRAMTAPTARAAPGRPACSATAE